MTSVEYEEIYNSTTSDVLYGNDDEYTKLMEKEQIVLDTVNRVVNQKELEQSQKNMLDAPVNVVVYRVFVVMKNVFKELYNMKPLDQVFKEDRRLYIGLFIVFCSVCFIILYKTG
uniref:Uncharacterized protein n=1 Tax=Pyramimonas orientalis virus TaxID=455367 RepID=A0A7L9AYT6_POV01|nr:hypothetical protein HWQ62_00294 [Pyramimonas orientalis virus]